MFESRGRKQERSGVPIFGIVVDGEDGDGCDDTLVIDVCNHRTKFYSETND